MGSRESTVVLANGKEVPGGDSIVIYRDDGIFNVAICGKSEPEDLIQGAVALLYVITKRAVEQGYSADEIKRLLHSKTTARLQAVPAGRGRQ